MRARLDSPPDPPGETPARKRKLAAILHVDVVGFSRLMGVDEAGTYRALGQLRAVVDPLIAVHGGRIVGTAGDSLLADFSSIVDALSCGVEMQRSLPSAVSSFGSVSISATSSSMAMTFSAMGSISPPGSRRWPSPAPCAFHRPCMTTSETNSISITVLLAAIASRTSPSRFAHTQ